MEEDVGQRHDEVHVLGNRDEEEEGGNRHHVGPVGQVHHTLGRRHDVLHPDADELRAGEFLTRFHDVGREGDGHDEQQDDVAFQLGLALELLRVKATRRVKAAVQPKKAMV